MSPKEINLESQTYAQKPKSGLKNFSVIKIAIGLTGIILVAGCGLTYAFKDQIFGSKKDTDTVVNLSNLATPAPAVIPTADSVKTPVKTPLIPTERLNANTVENPVMEPPVVKESDQAVPKVLNHNPNDASASNSVPAASEVNVDKNENLNPSSSKNIEKTNDLIDQEHFSGDGSDRSNGDGDDEDGESPVVDVDAQTLAKEKLADETLTFDKKLGTFMSIFFEKVDKLLAQNPAGVNSTSNSDPPSLVVSPGPSNTLITGTAAPSTSSSSTDDIGNSPSPSFV